MKPDHVPVHLRRVAPPRAPADLGPAGRRLWRSVTREFVLEGHSRAQLEAACQARDRLEEARAVVARDGAFVASRFGLKAHPGLAVERDSRIAMLRALRELGLDVGTATDRPPTKWR